MYTFVKIVAPGEAEAARSSFDSTRVGRIREEIRTGERDPVLPEMRFQVHAADRGMYPQEDGSVPVYADLEPGQQPRVVITATGWEPPKA